MRCYYEVLEVDREADDGEIKTAYRKLALKWHPDKNLDDTTTAKEQFQLVQQAYEVLSDRQERAWYDKHREQILRGANSEFKNDDLDIYQYFTTSCYKGYGDDDDGFYAVYRGVFEQLAKDDMEYMESKEEFCTIPTFGTSLSDYEEIVGPFYDYWMSYSTKKSYVWLDPHDIREAPNRRILKLIEKENDKVRQKAKKERNEEVRGLVAFVRKRDKRVQSYVKQLEAKKIENREKQQRLSKQKRLERIEQLNASGSQAEWMNFDNVKSQLEEVEKNLAEQFGDAISDEEESLSEEDINDLYCVACNKMFSNPKALANHELSKKHKENVQNLKELMLEQENECEEEFEDKNVCEDDLDEELDEDNSLHSSFEELPVEKTKKKNKKSKTVLKVASVSDHELYDNVVNNISDTEDNSESVPFNKKQAKKKNKKNKAVLKVESDTDHQLQNDDLNLSEDDGNSNCFSNNKKLKRKRRKEKQNLDEMAVNSKSSDCNTDGKVKAQSQETDLDKDHCCVKCKAQFSSKNKLFEHLKKTGHSTYLPSTNREAIQKTNKKIHKERIK